MGAVCLKKNSFVSQLALEISFIPGVRSITPYFVVLLRLSRLIITDIRTLYRVYKGTKTQSKMSIWSTSNGPCDSPWLAGVLI